MNRFSCCEEQTLLGSSSAHWKELSPCFLSPAHRNTPGRFFKVGEKTPKLPFLPPIRPPLGNGLGEGGFAALWDLSAPRDSSVRRREASCDFPAVSFDLGSSKAAGLQQAAATTPALSLLDTAELRI